MTYHADYYANISVAFDSEDLIGMNEADFDAHMKRLTAELERLLLEKEIAGHRIKEVTIWNVGPTLKRLRKDEEQLRRMK